MTATMAFSLVGAGVALVAGPASAAPAAQAPAPRQAAAPQEVVLQGAPPGGKAAATANPLYKSGALPTIDCSPGTIRPGSAASYKRFMTRVTRCLDVSWARQFKKARLTFSKPRLRFVTTTRFANPCGRWRTGATGVYCSANRTMYIGVTKRNVREPFPLGLAQFMAHEYAHHVQTVAGIGPNYYYPMYARSGKTAKLALSRRFELQADCLGSAFLRSVEHSLPVDPQQWEGMLDWQRKNGHRAWPTNDHGHGTSQAYWMQRGFAAGSPAGCNTWTAPNARVR
jgi:predicted metalloprotease